jgi:hypothetical protein
MDIGHGMQCVLDLLQTVRLLFITLSRVEIYHPVLWNSLSSRPHLLLCPDTGQGQVLWLSNCKSIIAYTLNLSNKHSFGAGSDQNGTFFG